MFLRPSILCLREQNKRTEMELKTEARSHRHEEWLRYSQKKIFLSQLSLFVQITNIVLILYLTFFKA